MRRYVKKPQFIIVCMGLLALAACKDPSFFQALGEKIATDSLSISPSIVTVPINGTVTFSGSGGALPYTYSVLPARVGAIDPTTGAYTAPTTQGTETVRATDKKGHMADAAVTIAGNTGALSIQPSAVSINVGGSITFVATGGSGTYSFAMQATGSAPPIPVVSPTGVYTAGNSPGVNIDRVRVSDGITFIDANITVTTTNSPVNYDISAAALPPAGTGGTALGGGYTFTIHNGGTGAGGAPISWWVFLSPTPAPGSGSALLASGSYAGPAIAPGATATVPLAWTWPSVLPPGGTRYLYILISAADDLTPANNTYTSAALTLSPANVHYTVSGVTNTGGIAAGGPLTGQFTLQNSGTEPGAYTVNWKAYASTDGTQRIDAGAVLLSSGSTSQLNGGASSAPINFSGTWPAAHGAYFLKVQVSAPDEVSPDPVLPAAPPWANTGVTAAQVDTTYVENGVQSVTASPTGVAGFPIAASSFILENTGLAAGTQTINWAAYVSANATLDAGDTLVSSGSHAGFAVGSIPPIAITGNWPAGTSGTRYLIVQISSADDTLPGNNTNVSATFVTVTAPDVKYRVPLGGVTNTPPSIAGGTINGSFTLNNLGTAAGSQTVFWTAYVSTDSTNTIDVGAKVVDSGTHVPVAAGGSPVQAFAGTWPAAAGTYYLKVSITAADDTTAGDDIMASSSVITTVPDYKVSTVIYASPAMAGRALSGTFTLQNDGSANGTKTVNWTVFVSTDAVLDAGDTAVAAGTWVALPAGFIQLGIPFSGTWPSATGSFFLFVKAVAADDTNPVNDVASANPTLTQADVNYSVTVVNNTPPSTAGGPLSGNFTLLNSGSVAGFQDIHWTVYVSTDTTLDAGDTIVASGTRAPLGAFATDTGIPFAGTWPSSFGSRRIIVKAEAGDDVPLGAGKTGVSAVVTVTRVDYAVTVVNWLTGTAAGAPFTANFTAKNNGDANGTQNLYWSAYTSNNALLDAGDALVASGFIPGGLGAGASQVVGFGGSWPTTLGSYFIIVSVSASDELPGLQADNQAKSAPATALVPPNVDYTVVAGSVSGTVAPPVAPATAVNGSFNYKNGGLNNGSQWVSWIVYASPNSTLDSAAVGIASGMAPPLLAGQTSPAPIAFSGTWPLSYGNYYLLVSLSTQEDVNAGNNTGASVGTSPVGIYTGIVQNGNCITWTNFTDLVGVVLKPGMRIVVHTASMPVTNIDHIFRLNTGTANTFTASWTMDVPYTAPPANNIPDLGLYYYTAPGVFDALQSYAISGVNSIGIRFTPDAPNAVRIIDLFNAKPKALASYTLTISAD